MTEQSPAPSPTPPPTDDFEVSIIDESGTGFDLSPSAVAGPLAATAGTLFALGIFAGVPAGIAMGRAGEDGKNAKLRPSMGGAFFALRAFAYGTALCGATGAAAVYATAWYCDAWTWQDFGGVMRRVVPGTKGRMEDRLRPVLDRVRDGAESGLPGPVGKARDRFGDSFVGKYIKGKIENATTGLDEGEEDKGSEG